MPWGLAVPSLLVEGVPVFRRRRKDQPSDEVEETTDPVEGGDLAEDASADSAADAPDRAAATPGSTFDRSSGPYDISEQPDDGVTRLDLGGIRVPGVEGMELRLEVDEAADQVVAVTVVHADSALQLTVFAAPRHEGIWDDVRGEIRGNLAGSGLVDEVTGDFGRELHATLTLTGPEGQSVMQPVRFVGIDGPRWFLRGLFSGAAARETAAAAPLEAVLRASVVVRGTDPMAPGDALPLHVPLDVPDGMSRQGDEPEPEGDGRKTLPPPKRGPEITEIR
jgi:hypothetical protein